jgi:DNA-binding transcriptional LysR family regulator
MQDGKQLHHKVSGSLRCNSGRALTDAARKALGLVQLPDYYVQSYIDRGELVVVLENWRDEDDRIWALYPHNRHLSSKVRMLVDYLVQHIE